MGSCSPLQAAHCMLGETEGGRNSASEPQIPAKKKGGEVTEERERRRPNLRNVRLQIV